MGAGFHLRRAYPPALLYLLPFSWSFQPIGAHSASPSTVATGDLLSCRGESNYSHKICITSQPLIHRHVPMAEFAGVWPTITWLIYHILLYMVYDSSHKIFSAPNPTSIREYTSITVALAK